MNLNNLYSIRSNLIKSANKENSKIKKDYYLWAAAVIEKKIERNQKQLNLNLK